MSQISLQRSVFALNVLGLIFVSALYVAIHGFDRQIWHTLGWAGVAAIGTFAGSRWLRKLSGADVENPEDEDGSSYSQTTLLKIALGLLKPSDGDILYGGQKISCLGIQNFRRQIGTVMQEDVLLTGSLADNIAFFDVQPDRARLEFCASMAQLHEDITRMPMGYETLVGDLGTGLSGGQKQRLLLARALYKQPRVLALDEATSHLDVNNERAVTEAIAHIPLTRLIIAHRAETIAGAMRVVQLMPTPAGVKMTELIGGEPKNLSAKAV